MNAELKQLIEISTVKGSITEDARNLIYSKAESLGVQKTECDIYIEGFLNTKKDQNKSENSNRKNWGIWLLICGIIDFIWGLYLASDKYTDEYALIFLISGALFLIFGFVLIGAFANKKVVGYIFLSLGTISLIGFLGNEYIRQELSTIVFFSVFSILFGLHKLEKLKPAIKKIESILSKNNK